MKNAGNSLSTGSTEEPVGESVLHFPQKNHNFNERSCSPIVLLLPRVLRDRLQSPEGTCAPGH